MNSETEYSTKTLANALKKVTHLRNKKGDLRGVVTLLTPYFDFAAEPSTTTIRYWQAMGTAYRDLGDATYASLHYDRGVAQAVLLNKDVLAADIRRAQAFGVLHLEHDPERATQLLEQAEQLIAGKRSHNARKVTVNIVALKGNIHFTKGEYLKAHGYFSQALSEAKILSMDNRIITLTGDLADTLLQLRNPGAAIQRLESTLPQARERYRHAVPPFLIRLSHAYRIIGNSEQAQAHAEEALLIAQTEGWNQEQYQAQEALDMLNQ